MAPPRGRTQNPPEPPPPAPPDQGKKGGSGSVVGRIVLTLYDRPENNVEADFQAGKRPLSIRECDAMLKWGLAKIADAPVPSKPLSEG